MFSLLQPDQINMAVFFFVTLTCPVYTMYCTRVHWRSQFIQGTRNTRPCLTGDPVGKLAIVPGCPSSGGGGGSSSGGESSQTKPEPQSTDDEWKNVQVVRGFSFPSPPLSSSLSFPFLSFPSCSFPSLPHSSRLFPSLPHPSSLSFPSPSYKGH